jgi:diacylglycerol O-acyltransferase / wax synthase
MPLDRLSVQDAQILRLEAGAIRGHTCKVLVLEPVGGGPLPTLADLRAQIDANLDAAPRLRRRLAPTPLGVARPVWVDDADFDVARHVVPVGIGRPVSRADVGDLVAALFAQRLDRAHPLWRLDVIERVEDGTCVLVWRIHHALADGKTAVRLGSAVLWSPEPDPGPAPAPSWRPDAPPAPLRLLALGLADRARRAPARRRGSLRSLVRSRDAVRRELVRTASVSSLAARAGAERAVDFVDAPLGDCRQAGKAVGSAVTVNDVALAIVTGGVRAWLSAGGGPTAGEVRVKVPVSLHEASEDGAMANRDSFFFVDLPVGEPDAAARLLAINAETSVRKREHDAEALYPLGLHRAVERWAMSPRVFTFNVSNVPGPRHDVFVAGARVRELYSLAEIAERHALRVAVVSAAGRLFFGLCADREAVPDLDVVAEGMRRAVDELLARR